MDLQFNPQLIQNYHNASQIARVLTEDWVKHNGYCPHCCSPLQKAPNNRPVQDFFCSNCAETFELKSKRTRTLGSRICDGAYQTMIDKIRTRDLPNFFFLTYNKQDYTVNQFIIVPKHFFTEDMIIRRKALKATAQRAGWVGCNINIKQLPENGKIFIIKDRQIIAPHIVRQKWHSHLFLRQQDTGHKSWLIAIMRCLDKLPEHFTLQQMYQFVPQLQQEFPKNQNIEAKIRQQLQILRDQNSIAFIARGHYRKILF